MIFSIVYKNCFDLFYIRITTYMSWLTNEFVTPTKYIIFDIVTQNVLSQMDLTIILYFGCVTCMWVFYTSVGISNLYTPLKLIFK